MGTPGAAMLFAIPPLAVYAVAYWFGVMGRPRAIPAPAPAPRTTAVDNAVERFEKPSRKRNGQFAQRA